MKFFNPRHAAANWRWERGLENARWFFNQTVFYEPRKFTFDDLWPEVGAQSAVLNPDVYHVLSDLRASKRYKVATLNNESRELNDYRIKTFDLRIFFDFFICSGYVYEMKPEPGIYRSALEVSQTPPGQTVFIDDKEENCATARNLGMNAIRFTSTQPLRSALSEFGITL